MWKWIVVQRPAALRHIVPSTRRPTFSTQVLKKPPILQSMETVRMHHVLIYYFLFIPNN